MALQTSGNLSFTNIQTEFGGSNPIALSEYYAGGTYVPAGTSGTNGAVPSSGSIAVSKFYGTSKQTIVTVTEGYYTTGAPAFIEYYGYYGAVGAGSRSPTTLNGQSIQIIAVWGLGAYLTVRLAGSLSQSFFTSVKISGKTASLLTSSATYTNGGTYTEWTWPAFSPAATGWDGTGSSTATFA